MCTHHKHLLCTQSYSIHVCISLLRFQRGCSTMSSSWGMEKRCLLTESIMHSIELNSISFCVRTIFTRALYEIITQFSAFSRSQPRQRHLANSSLVNRVHFVHNHFNSHKHQEFQLITGNIISKPSRVSNWCCYIEHRVFLFFFLFIYRSHMHKARQCSSSIIL